MQGSAVDGGGNEELLRKACRLFERGGFEEARTLLGRFHGRGVGDARVRDALRCGGFWQIRSSKLKGMENPLEKGEFLIKQWQLFSGEFVPSLGELPESVVYAVKTWVFSTSLACYKGKPSDQCDSGVIRNMGLCFKAMGNYDRAILAYGKACDGCGETPEMLAQLADCYALTDEERFAKVLFREAFYLDPQEVDLSALESSMMRKLIAFVEERKGVEECVVKEWIPVYGVIAGIFNVDRELRPAEYGRLNRSIVSLEGELKAKIKRNCLVPRLINRYFWLIDHHTSIGGGESIVEAALATIKCLDRDVYESYIK